MNKYLLLAAVFVCAMLTACDQAVKPVAYAQACNAENHQKYVQVSGFLDDENHTMVCSDANSVGPARCRLKLFERAGTKTSFTVEIEQGMGPNKMEPMKDKYSYADVKIHNSRDETFGKGMFQLKLTGKMSVSKNPAKPENDVCAMTVTKIEMQ
jgi:hypothetical protein